MENICTLFQHSYHPDEGIRKQAELQIKQISHQPGFVATLLTTIAHTDIDLPTRQAASIFFKNLVCRSWDAEYSDNRGQVHDQDKAFVREKIMEALIQAPPQIKSQLSCALGVVLKYDFPESWPTFIELVASLLTSSDHRVISGGLVGFLEVVKNYQWSSGKNRAPLNKIVKDMFPMLNKIAVMLLSEDDKNIEAVGMLKTIIKTFHLAIRYDLPKALQDPNNLASWGQVLVQVVDRVASPGTVPDDPDEMLKHPWWKAKKWSFRALHRLFSRYGNPALETFKDGSYKTFAKNFMDKFVPTIMTAFFTQLERHINKSVVLPNKVLVIVLNFFTDCVKSKTTWSALKPHVSSIISQCIYPQLCISEADEELWSDDPVEYVQKRADPYEDFDSPVQASLGFLLALLRDRSKVTLQPTLEFIQSVLVQSNDVSSHDHARQKDGVLTMVGAMADILTDASSPVSSQMPTFILTHVVPAFESPFPFLRSKTCQVIKAFSEIEFPDMTTWVMILGKLLACLKESELPLKIDAAFALESVLDKEVLRETFKPYLVTIMQELLALTQQIDSETLALVMERIVAVFPSEVAPFSVQLVASLRDSFLRLISENLAKITGDADNYNDDDDFSDKIMAASGMLKTIDTVVMSVGSNSEIMAHLEKESLPMIICILQNEILDLYEETVELLHSFIFEQRMVSAVLWPVFPLIYRTLKESAIDFLEDIAPAIEVFIAYGAKEICQQEDLQNMLTDLINTVLTSDCLDTADKLYGFRFMEIFILHSRGMADKFIEPFMLIALNNLNASKSTAHFVHCMNIIIDAFYYNPLLAFSVLEKHQRTTSFFEAWIKEHTKFSRVHDKKLSIMATLVLVQLPLSSIPASIQPGWHHLITLLMHYFETLPKAMEERERIEHMYANESDYEDDEDDDEDGFVEPDSDEEGQDAFDQIPDEEYDVPDEDAAYMQYLAEQANKQEDGYDTEDDEDWRAELGEELFYETPLDEVDVYVEFENVVSQRADLQQVLEQTLSDAQKQVLRDVLAKAESNRREKAESTQSKK